ncbi:MAG: tetratricopeptide repeat protein [Bauldia sp.]
MTRRDAYLATAAIVAFAILATATFLLTRSGGEAAPAIIAEATPAFQPEPRPDPAAGEPATPAAATDLDPAYGAYQRRLYRTAMELALPLAEAGNRVSQTLMGILLAEGFGVPQDFTESAGWFQLAANAGEPYAQFQLGLYHLNGTGVAEDAAAAVRYLELSAAQDNRDALFALAVMALEAGAIEDDEERRTAIDRLARAAELGLAAAQYELGRQYVDGDNVIRNDQIANAWLRRSAEQGYVDAEIDYGIRLANGVGAPRDEEAAAGWLRRAAISGNPVGQARYGQMLAAGIGVAPDPVAAATYYLLARSAGLEDPFLADFFAGLTAEQQAEATDAAADLGRP